MWLDRLRARLGSATAIHGDEGFGAPYLIDDLRRHDRLAWLRIAPSDEGDPVAQGDRLANALNPLLDRPVFPSGVPYPAHLRLLARRREELGPLVIAVSSAERAPAFARELVEARPCGVRVVIDSAHPLPDLAPLPTLGPDDLRMRPDEALELAPRSVSEARVRELHEAADGRYAEVMRRIALAAGAPLPSLPEAGGPRLPTGLGAAFDPALVVRALAREARWTEAVELAVHAAPHLLEDLLAVAGPAFRERGLLPRLSLLLESLGEPWALRERVLEWRLVAGAACGSSAHADALEGRGGLRLRVLGRSPHALLDRERVHLTPRQLDIALALTLHPDGLAGDELHEWLVAGTDVLGLHAVYTHVHRLRAALPVLEQPYRFAVPVSADVQDLMDAVRRGDAAACATLSADPLLPRSTAPGVRALRENLEADAREVVLASGDAEALYEIAMRGGDDLEAWQGFAERAPRDDPRHAVATARIARLRQAWGRTGAAP